MESPQPALVVDTMLLVEGVLAPMRGVGGTAYTSSGPHDRMFVCVATRREAPHPMTFAEFDLRFGVLYDAGGYRKVSSPPSELRPVGVLDALRGCYVSPKDRTVMQEPPCMALLNSTAEECFREEQEALTFTYTGTAGDTLSKYIIRHLPQRAQVREMIARSISFTVDMVKLQQILLLSKTDLPSEEYKEVIQHTQQQLNILLREHQVLVKNKWILLQGWLGTTTSSSCSVVSDVQRWISSPKDVTVKTITIKVLGAMSKMFNTMTTKGQEGAGAGRESMMDSAVCAAASLAIGAAFLDDLAFLQVNPASHSAEDDTTKWVLETVNALAVFSDMTYLRDTVQQKWMKFNGELVSMKVWKCLSGFFLVNPPAVSPLAVCFEDQTTAEAELDFRVSDNNPNAAVIVNTGSARRVEYRFFWPSIGSLSLSAVQATCSSSSSSVQKGLFDCPLPEDQLPPFPPGVVGVVPKNFSFSGNEKCPAGMFAMERDGFYCVDCVNGDGSFIYCPGDGVMHECRDKPVGALCVPTGLRPSSTESCRYHCADPYTFLLDGVCEFHAGFYNHNGKLEQCILPSDLIGPVLTPYQKFVGSGAIDHPESCSFAIRRRMVSEEISHLPPPLRWCGRDTTTTMGSTVQISMTVFLSAIRSHHIEKYGKNKLQGVTAVAYELVSVIPDSWSWYLISYLDPTTPASPPTAATITMQLVWNASFSSDVFFSENWTLHDGCLSCPTGDEVELSVSLSWDPSLEEVLFFVNGKVLGKPFVQPGARRTASADCPPSTPAKNNHNDNHQQIAVGGWTAVYESQVEFVGRNSANRLPKFFEYIPGELHHLLLKSDSLPPLGWLPEEAPLFPTPANASFAAGLFAVSTCMADLAGTTGRLQHQARQYHTTAKGNCRLGSQRSPVTGTCLSCPSGSYATLAVESPLDGDAVCTCVSTQRMSYNQVSCIRRSNGYGPPISSLYVPSDELILPLDNPTSAVQLVRFIVDEFTRPFDAPTSLQPHVVVTVQCDPGFTLFDIGASPSRSTAVVWLNNSLGILGEQCTVGGAVKMDPFLESPQITNKLMFTLRAPSLTTDNINIDTSAVLSKDQRALWLQASGYSLLLHASVGAFYTLELDDKQRDVLPRVFNESVLHVSMSCGSGWNVTRALTFDDIGVLLPLPEGEPEGEGCVLSLSVVSAINGFLPSASLVITVASCMGGQSEALSLMASKWAVVITSVLYFASSLLTVICYTYAVMRDAASSEKRAPQDVAQEEAEGQQQQRPQQEGTDVSAAATPAI